MFPCESQFAKHLENRNKSWVYQPERFKLKNTTYRADFYCPEDDTYYEVVGTRQAISALKWKIQEFIRTYPDIKFKIVKPNGENYYYNRNKQKETTNITKYAPSAKQKEIQLYPKDFCRYCIDNCKQTRYAKVIFCPQYREKSQ